MDGRQHGEETTMKGLLMNDARLCLQTTTLRGVTR